jgi:hypothetical protein
MDSITPDDLLNSTITRGVAPWCVALDNLELGIALLAQPWIEGTGLRRSDFERQLGALASSLPLGHVYFQRINRAVSNLESRGVLLGSGGDRDRRFVLAPEGFAALILNLHVLQADPTLDGREFEFKLELVAHWNLTLDRLLTSPPDIVPPSSMQSFFERVEQLTVLGKSLITFQVIKDAFSLTRLIGHQRANVTRLKSQAEARLAQTHTLTEFFRTADLSQLNLEGLTDQAVLLKDSPAMQEVLRTIATSGAPQLNARAQIIRYETYLDYLDRLEHTYSSELKIVDINLFRRRVAGAGG